MPLSGLNDVFNRLVDFTTDIDEIEFALWMFFMRMTVVDSVYKLVNILGVSMLTSRDSLISGLQGPLPDDQWQIDVEHWLSTYLAALQKGFVDFATGPSDPHMAPFLLMPYGNKSDTFCKKQVGKLLAMRPLVALSFQANYCQSTLENSKQWVNEHIGLRPLYHSYRWWHRRHTLLYHRAAPRVHSQATKS